MKLHLHGPKKRFFIFILRPVLLFLLLAVTASIGMVSANYFPPDFSRGFLFGKESFFYGIYACGLYTHIFTAPLLIVLSSLLIFFRLETSFPKTHRFLGKMVVIIGLLLFVPSGFILASHAIGGWYGIILFNWLTLLSAISLFLAYRFARQRQIDKHRKWMLRFYMFLISAIFLRINKFIFGYYFNYFGEESYLLSVLLSWLPQWIILEIVFTIRKFKIHTLSS